mmetsp:Transcript_31910/g.54441  ORF Transcript_31910/g.54441 Transcript_31910/m.54441 type:complete len:230 (+) Transcript_31910:236-925(+)
MVSSIYGYGLGYLSLCFASAQLLHTAVAFSNYNNAITRSRNNAPRPHATCMAMKPPVADADLLPEIRDEILEREGELTAWEDSVEILSDLFDEDDAAEIYLADAFRWKAWASASDMMRKYQRPVLPEASKISEGIAWLKEGPLGMSDDQIRNNIQQYPGIYLREPNVFYKKVMGAAPRKYRDDEVLKQLIGDDPNILQVTFNCDGEGCQSECGSCWVTYENRLPTLPNF